MWLNIPQITINRWCKPFPVMGSLWHCFNHINLIVMWIMVLLVPCWDTCLTQPTAWWWWFWIWSLVDENCNDHRWAPYDSAHFKQTWTLKHIKAINYITYVTRYPICLHIPGRLRPRQGPLLGRRLLVQRLLQAPTQKGQRRLRVLTSAPKKRHGISMVAPLVYQTEHWF